MSSDNQLSASSDNAEIRPSCSRIGHPYYVNAFPAHDQFHARRVHDLSIRLANQCDGRVNQGVLRAAALFHDIGRPRERTGTIDNHGRWAADEATELLAATSVPADHIEAIEHCLRSHSIRASSPEPETSEVKVLFDADKLDAVSSTVTSSLYLPFENRDPNRSLILSD